MALYNTTQRLLFLLFLRFNFCKCFGIICDIIIIVSFLIDKEEYNKLI